MIRAGLCGDAMCGSPERCADDEPVEETCGRGVAAGPVLLLDEEAPVEPSEPALWA